MADSSENFALALAKRLRAKESTIGVVGLGYVGLPICLAAVHSGLNVIGFDIDPMKPLSTPERFCSV